MDSFPPMALRRRHTQTVADSSSSYKKEYMLLVENFLNPEGHKHCVICSKVKIILPNVGILKVGGVTSGRFCDQWGYPI